MHAHGHRLPSPSRRKDVVKVVEKVHQEYESSVGRERAHYSRTLVVLLIYTSMPPGRGREYREMVLQQTNGPPRVLQERTNIFHHNTITGASHIIVADHKTSRSNPAQVIQCPDHPLFKSVVHEYITRHRDKLLSRSQTSQYFILVGQ